MFTDNCIIHSDKKIDRHACLKVVGRANEFTYATFGNYYEEKYIIDIDCYINGDLPSKIDPFCHISCPHHVFYTGYVLKYEKITRHIASMKIELKLTNHAITIDTIFKSDETECIVEFYDKIKELMPQLVIYL